MVPGTSRVPFDEEEQGGPQPRQERGDPNGQGHCCCSPTTTSSSLQAGFAHTPSSSLGIPWIRSSPEDRSSRSQLRTWVHGLPGSTTVPSSICSGSWGSGSCNRPTMCSAPTWPCRPPCSRGSACGTRIWEHADGSIDVRRYGAAGQSGRQGEAYGLPRHSDPAPGSSGQLLTGTHPPERFRARSQRLLEGRAHEHRGSLRCPGSVSFADSPHWCGTFSRRVSSWHGSGLAAERLRWSGRDRRRGGPADPTRRCGRGGTEHDFR